MSESTFRERLKIAMDKHGYANANKLSKTLKTQTAENIGRVLRDDKNAPSFKLLADLTRVFPNLNFTWLLSGIGNIMVADTSDIKPQTNVKSLQLMEPKSAYITSIIDKTAIPLVDVRAAAGFGSASFAISESDIQAHYVVPDFEEINFMLRVVGNSMYPKYTSGDVIACRIVKNIQFIQWGKAYLVATGDQGLLIKRIMPTNDSKVIEMQSDNPAYPPFLINMSDIQGLALVVGTIRLE